METEGLVLVRQVGEFLKAHEFLISERMQTYLIILLFVALALAAIGERRGWGWLETGALSIGALAVVSLMATEAIKSYRGIVTSESRKQIQLIVTGLIQ